MNNVYPSIEELLPDLLLSVVPYSLANEITERYRTLGEKYLTEGYTDDGRRINACMYKSSLQDCKEEVIDAVFNMLVQIFKDRQWEIVMEDNVYTIFRSLIQVYGLLINLQALEQAADATV